jgi:hypothetical protein
MNINGKLDLYKNSLGGLKLSDKKFKDMTMQTTICTSDEKSVAMNFQSGQNTNQKHSKPKEEEAKEINNEKIERNPLILLKLY